MTIILALHAICIYFFLKRNSDVPVWLKLFALSPQLISPLVMFVTIFFFDAPGVSWKAVALFILANAYTFLIYIGAFWACSFYRKGFRRWALVPPSLFTLINLSACLALFGHRKLIELMRIYFSSS